MLGYMIIDIPPHGVTAWRFSLQDTEQQQQLAALCGKLSSVSAPGSTEDVFGAKSETVNRILEDRYRAWIATHFKSNLGKLVHGLKPESASAEVTWNGHQTSRVVVLDSEAGRRSVDELLRDLRSCLQVAIRPGQDFAIVELAPDGIRIHQARYRAIDRRFALLHPILKPPVNSEPEQKDAVRPHSVLSKLNGAILAD